MPDLVILNQEANYLTTGLANSFKGKFNSVTLLVGVLYSQGEPLDADVKIVSIKRMSERPSWKKAWSYLVALVQMWWLLMTRFRQHEVLFVSVPPMGYLLNLLLPHRFSMVIWDLYPDTFKVTGMTEHHPLYRFWGWLNRKSFRKAYRVFTIGEVLADAIAKYVDRNKLKVHPIWSMYDKRERVPRDKNLFIKQHELQDKFIVQYSGNIGVTHNVELMIDLAEEFKANPRILFQIIGRGPRLQVIEDLVKVRSLPNVQFLPFQSEEMFPHSISAADLGVVILNDKVSRGSVPSKAYNLMSFGIPSLYISSPDSQLAIDARRYGHARCFSASQQSAMVDFINQISQSSELRQLMSQAARKASDDYLPSNSVKFVENYFAN